MYECQEVSNTALHNFPRLPAFKEGIRNENQDQIKIFDRAGFEPKTSGLDHRRSTS